ncbi:polysaccharide deacetylase family protein [Paenibacillus caui]|uniref:polysaccharide deacetylase family protein n=1 Tax=Paenibacillus caui TaxID=2873927 RepID=UPI0030809BB0
MNKKLAASLAAALILMLFGGMAVWHKDVVKRGVRHVLVRAGFKGLSDSGQSAKLPILRKPSAKPTPNAVYYRDGVIVLMYHEVKPVQSDAKTLLVSKFKEQLNLMKANGFHWITMSQYTNFILHHGKIPDNAVLLTFDDGYESFYQYAYPVLRQYHAPATNFLIVNTISNVKHIGIPKLTWGQIRLMHRSGIDFFNHTFDSHSYSYTDKAHRHLKPLLAGPIYSAKDARKETEPEYEDRIYNDLSRAKEMLHRELDNTYDVLAFPYGAFSEDTIKVCRELGIEVTFTVKRGMNHAGQLNGYRVNGGGGDNEPDVIVEYMKEGAPEKNLTLNKPYDLIEIK